MSTYIKDIFDLPEQVGAGDFVLALTRGVEHAGDTLGSYVVTPQLADAFDEALSFIGGALDSGKSRASYLHGSFGSGKSHFMAVLHLLLQGNTQARSIQELAGVVTKRATQIDGKRFLLVPYHMIGAHSMESAILGHYAEHVRKLHPEAPRPAIYLADSLFENAHKLRTSMGDDSFFKALNEGSGGGTDEGWGDLAVDWTSETLDAALSAPANDDRRLQLVSALVSTLLPSYADVAHASGEGFISLDHGLAVISQHAKALKYDAVILFLDELILWLASRAADFAFLNREGPKLGKLVEAESADRPIPLVSFIARQRDLRELVGEHIAGAEQLGFADVLSFWESRFHKITLEDRNLPKIAEKRVLKPVSDEAREKLDHAFAETEKTRREILQVLLTDESDLTSFRQIYPFSPALMETLVAVSSVLQRERTALKVMLQLLVDQRDTLELGQIVPVGDLFDVIAEGDEPFTEGMRVNFENAKRLWRTKLLPLLEKEHGAREEEFEVRPATDPQARAFRANGRLLKTLLLAALAPEVKSLKALTADRLAALNHGSIKTPIPGQEAQEVLSRMRRWAGQVGEIKISDDPQNPVIACQIFGVDTESIVENNRAADNVGNRRKKVREMLFQQLGIQDRGELQITYEKLWRGTRRSFDIVFGNVRELPDESLRAKDDDRKIVIDFPFDPENHASADDLARIEEFRSNAEGSRTLVWLPSFLSLDGQRDLGTLVVLEDLLAGERFEQCASHLTAVDRVQARSILDNQRSQLRQRVLSYLEGAYGTASPPPGSIDQAHSLEDHFQSLLSSFAPRPPVSANLGQAFEHLLDQILDNQFPKHPRFEEEAKSVSLAHIFDQVERAVQAEGQRVAIDSAHRKIMRGIAVPLELGEMGEMHFVLGPDWAEHFDREAAKDGATEITAGLLREWIDRPEPRGLPKEVENLVILSYAAQTNRSFFLHGGSVSPDLKKLSDDTELRTEKLPDRETWEAAVERAGALFGITASKLLNAANKTKLAEELVGAAQAHRQAAAELLKNLEPWIQNFAGGATGANRVTTARASQALVEAIHAAGAEGAIEALVAAKIETSEAAMGSSLKKAAEIAAALASTPTGAFEALGKVPSDKVTAANKVLGELAESLKSDEYATGLISVLPRLGEEALKVIVEPPKPTLDKQVLDSGAKAGLSLKDARTALETIADKEKDGRVEVDLTWRIYRKGDKK